jgi:hypothetical protein
MILDYLIITSLSLLLLSLFHQRVKELALIPRVIVPGTVPGTPLQTYRADKNRTGTTRSTIDQFEL